MFYLNDIGRYFIMIRIRAKSSVEEDTSPSSKKRTGTLERMENSYRRRQRDKKIKKLSDNSDHWKGLE